MYDIIILGAGPGGYELALEASKKGLSIALIEADEVGGTCLNYGCIPTKTYYQNAKFINETYEKALQRKEEALVNYLDYTHALLNILTLVRGKKRGDTTASLLANYLKQGVLSEETFSALVNGDTHTIYAYLKNNFNIDASESESTVELEEKLDEYLFNKLKILAMDSDFKPTLIYYIKRKQLQIERLRNIVYTKRNG